MYVVYYVLSEIYVGFVITNKQPTLLLKILAQQLDVIHACTYFVSVIYGWQF